MINALASSRINVARPTRANPSIRRVSRGDWSWPKTACGCAAAVGATLVATACAASSSTGSAGLAGGGPFWGLYPAWAAAGQLAALARLVVNPTLRALSVLQLGVSTIGLLG
jgi:hypothetical protein